MFWLPPIFLFPPSREQSKEVADSGAAKGYNYRCPGASRDAPPLDREVAGEGWVVDHHRFCIGHGKKCYHRAKEVLSQWRHFQLDWAKVPEDTPMVVDSPVCVVTKILVPWVALPLKVVYVGESRREVPSALHPGRMSRCLSYTFASGCTAGHLLAGEERFQVDWVQEDDSVWFDIFTFSRPVNPWAVVGYPVVRFLQASFRGQSAASMKAALQDC